MTTASLLAADGTAVASALVDDPEEDFSSILIPKAPLVEGATYTVRWTDDCVGIRTRDFVATASAPLPSTAGAVFPGEAVSRPTGATTQTGEPASSLERPIAFVPAKELEPFLPISSGWLVTRDSYARPAFRAGGYFPRTTVGTALRKCPFPEEPIVQHVALRVRIPNRPAITTDEVAVELICPDRSTTPPAATTSADDETSGCATHATSHNEHALVLLTALALLRRARRDGASRTSPRPSASTR